MGAFNVKFGIDSSYSDPEYRFIYVKTIGQAEVSCDDREGSERDQEYVKSLIGLAVMETLSSLSAEQVSYKHLVSHKDRFISAVKEQFAPKNITLSSFALMNVTPDEKSREMMAKADKMKEMSKMTPEELAKKQQEAMEEAKRRWDALSPEEKARIEAETKRKADEAVKQMKEAQALAQKMAAPMAASAQAPVKKFCGNCGSPANGGKFCSNCGNPL